VLCWKVLTVTNTLAYSSWVSTTKKNILYRWPQVSLAVADTITLVASVPQEILSYHILGHRWVWGPVGCTLMIYLQYLGIDASGNNPWKGADPLHLGVHSHNFFNNYNKRLFDMTRYGLLIICSCDHLKHYNSQGLVDGSIYRKWQKMPNSKFGSPDCIGLLSKKEVGAKVALNCRDQAVAWLVHLEGTRTGVLSCQTKWSKKWKGWGQLEPMIIASSKVAKW